MDSFVIFLAKYLVLGIGLLAVIAWLSLNRPEKTRFIGTLLLAAILAYSLSRLASIFYYHPRPFVSEHIKPLIAHANDNGFPSDHTWFSMTVATVVYFFNRRWGGIAFILTLIIGLGRIWAHLHYPVDILGGLIIGAMAGIIAYQTYRNWPKVISNARRPVNRH